MRLVPLIEGVEEISQPPDLFQVEGRLQNPLEPHHDVGDLDPRVVDVVLHLHGAAEEAEALHEGVPQDGVAQVTHVGRLVGVDVGVLDDDLARDGRGRVASRQQVVQRAAPVQVEVQVAARGLDLADSGQSNAREFRRDGVGRALEGLGQGEGDGGRRVAHVGLGREREGDLLGGPLHLELVPDRLSQRPLPSPHCREHGLSLNGQLV